MNFKDLPPKAVQKLIHVKIQRGRDSHLTPSEKHEHKNVTKGRYIRATTIT